MSSPRQTYDEHLTELIHQAARFDLASEGATTAMQNLEKFSKCAPAPDPEPEPTPEPLTRWGRVRASVACALDNETTRTFIKAGGAFAGVGLVVWSTIHRDGVLDRQSLDQANKVRQ